MTEVIVEIRLDDGSVDKQRAEGERFTVGRDPECDFVVPDRGNGGFVSSVHVELECKNGQILVSDARSTNGTVVSGDLISGPTAIPSGQSIKLGEDGPYMRISVSRVPSNLHAGPTSSGNRSAVLWCITGALGVLAVWLIAAFAVRQPNSPSIADKKTGSSADPDHELKKDATTLVPFAAVGESVELFEGEIRSIDVLDNEALIEGQDVFIESVAEASSGGQTRIDRVNGRISYTAPSDGTTSDSFSYTLRNTSGAKSSATVSLSVKKRLSPLSEVEAGVNWVGFEFEDEVFISDTCWVLSPSRVVCAARSAVFLRQLKEKKQNALRLIVYANGGRHYVSKIRVHPSFDFTNPGSARSLAHDWATFEVEERFSPESALKLSAVREFDIDCVLRYLGFEYRGELTEPFDRLKIDPCSGELTISGTVSSVSPYAYRTERPSRPASVGTVVVDERCKVIGQLTVLHRKSIFTPVANVNAFLSEE